MYKSKLNIKETQKAIQDLKKFFQKELQRELNLTRATAPLFIERKTGLNDGLNGEKAVSFNPKGHDNINLEVVHSLAKWKRNALKQYNYDVYEGIYTDMNAIRREEDLDDTHSYYVDQWDWERIIKKEDRNLTFLFDTVRKIYNGIYNTKEMLVKEFKTLTNDLAKEVYFISSQDLENLYPNLTLSEREDQITKEKGAVFVYQIGHKLKSGLIHSLRAFDYDDWNLNGDLLVYSNVLNKTIELSSMGIRVDERSIVEQSQKSEKEVKLLSNYHKDVVEKTLPLTIGGGIGQSRLSMFLLEKIHIGEVQASFWPDEYRGELKKKGIELL
ncbi:asparagine synthetase AsnA [Mycoplasmopsis canis UFG1]|uniref:Aspartate--ammonia ligase n=1 Tax=Mycoplasmopsis canis TaxID=29555 RepID=A0A449AQ13_9BACT|nr:aspartate--ammonia ligase [Mycoplasmopsis canis]AMD81368.1 aspartate--ammonia ligase [Mycoplasmopsis canis PG 14]EIE40841.1 asparagine synthetase AsnA [Mycoplasmopsis canis PG 14]EIE42057.1 asparagine synthetase AsnA [Mycoplasmopsis canis UFG1]VEU68654.1 Aspartate--ammonia ligase [Mycoplasmopsis canis]